MVEYLQYKDEKLPVRITFTALSKFQQETTKSIDDLDNLGANLILIEPLLFFSLEAGFKADKKVFEIKRKDMPDILDECWQLFMENIEKFIYFGPPPKPGSTKKK